MYNSKINFTHPAGDDFETFIKNFDSKRNDGTMQHYEFNIISIERTMDKLVSEKESLEEEIEKYNKANGFIKYLYNIFYKKKSEEKLYIVEQHIEEMRDGYKIMNLNYSFYEMLKYANEEFHKNNYDNCEHYLSKALEYYQQIKERKRYNAWKYQDIL